MVVIGVEGARCAFENEYGDPPVEFAQFRIDVTVLEPAQTVVGQRRSGHLQTGGGVPGVTHL